MALELGVLGAVVWVFGLVSALELRDRCFACVWCWVGKCYTQKVPLLLCFVVFCNVVLDSTVELSRPYFEPCFQLVVLCCAWCRVLRYFELSFKDFEMVLEKSFEKKMHGFGKGF